MSETTNPDVVQELVTPVEEASLPTEQTQEVSQEPKLGSQEYNFREMRRLLEEQQREIRALREDSYSREAPQQQEEEPDETAHMRKTDFLTVGQAEKLALRKAEELLRQREVDNQEYNTQLQYPDYNNVVSKENIDEIIKDRDVAEAIRNSPNPYAAAYKMIKNSASFNQRQQLAQKRAVDADKIAKNASKPLSSNAIQSKPLVEANAFVMNEQLRNELAREMYESAKRR